MRQRDVTNMFSQIAPVVTPDDTTIVNEERG